ncbi:MAG: hypothetical protein LE168_03835 [Endomicrobium sp.]|nr:hypothetical protein [Endomicrobium sp.]
MSAKYTKNDADIGFVNGLKPKNNKFETVINKNTFYFYNSVFQDKYEAYLIP